MTPGRIVAGAVVMLWAACCVPARAADVTVLCSNGFKAVMEEVVPAFQRESGDVVLVQYDLSAVLARRIAAGERFDLAVLTPALIDDLARQGLVAPDSAVSLARSPIRIAVRAGAPKPDLGTLAAVKDALRGSRSIAYAREGASAGFFLALVRSLGLSDALAPRVVAAASGLAVGTAVARGESDFGVLPLSEILPIPGIEPAGPFPPDLAGYMTMTSAVAAHATQRTAALALAGFLRAPAVRGVLVAKGMEPPP